MLTRRGQSGGREATNWTTRKAAASVATDAATPTAGATAIGTAATTAGAITTATSAATAATCAAAATRRDDETGTGSCSAPTPTKKVRSTVESERPAISDARTAIGKFGGRPRGCENLRHFPSFCS